MYGYGDLMHQCAMSDKDPVRTTMFFPVALMREIDHERRYAVEEEIPSRAEMIRRLCREALDARYAARQAGAGQSATPVPSE